MEESAITLPVTTDGVNVKKGGEDDSEMSFYWLIGIGIGAPFLLLLFIGYKIWQRRRTNKDISLQKQNAEKKAAGR